MRLPIAITRRASRAVVLSLLCALLPLPGGFATNGPGFASSWLTSDIRAVRQGLENCSPSEGEVTLSVEAAEVTHLWTSWHAQDLCEQAVQEGETRPIALEDSIEVGEDGRATLTRDSMYQLVLFGDSSLSIGPDLFEDDHSYPQVYLDTGAATVDNSAVGDESLSTETSTETAPTEPAPGSEPTSVAADTSRVGMVVETDSAALKSLAARFFLYTDAEGFIWVVVSDGSVDLAGEEDTVRVPAGSQSWIEADSPPQEPLPATRSVVDVQFERELPTIGRLTDSHLVNEDVFASCQVTASEGADLLFGPDQDESVRDQLTDGATFAASYQASDAAWLFGIDDSGQGGWTDASLVQCPYDSALLPESTDADADATADAVDNCVGEFNPDQADQDSDDIGDACDFARAPTQDPTEQPAPEEDTDTDGDGIPDVDDNCDNDPIPDQTDTDGDGVGDICDEQLDDPDTDSDGIPNRIDNCDNNPNPDQTDTDGDGDGDGVGDVCDGEPAGGPDSNPDSDGDGTHDFPDNCPAVPNPDQEDADDDDIGDVCDSDSEVTEQVEPPPTDSDGDGVPDDDDNCPGVSTSNREDSDGDGVGDACDAPPTPEPTV